MVMIESTPEDFGRIAAQTAKQVILQRIREAERDALYNNFSEREGEIINGTVQSVTGQGVTLNLGRTEALLPKNQQVPGERYNVHQRLRAYVLEVRKTPRGPQIIVSRNHKNMLRRLLELEVPEIYNGAVEIKSIAREAGARSKIAVAAKQPGVDPVGSCVGMRGVRIQSIVNELNGEKIDVVEWSPEPGSFIANGLSPAKVLNVILQDDNDGKTAVVVVPDKQLSLAIGKEGQNARLAAKLTGWRIDIKSATEAAEEALRKAFEKEPVRQATTRARDILAIAEEILREKEGTTLSDGELQALSQAIQVVDEAEAALKIEQAAPQLPAEAAEPVAEAEQAPAAAEPSDLLTQAEALLFAKDKAREEAQAAVEGMAAAEYAGEPALAEAEAALEAPPSEAVVVQVVEAEPLEAKEAEGLATVEAVAELGGEAVVAEATPGAVPELALAEALEPEFEADWSEEAEGEEQDVPGRDKAKKKKVGKKRELVYDENLGEVVAQRKRKPGRQRREWEEY
jgi:N utilization substance protein A